MEASARAGPGLPSRSPPRTREVERCCQPLAWEVPQRALAERLDQLCVRPAVHEASDGLHVVASLCVSCSLALPAVAKLVPAPAVVTDGRTHAAS